MIGKITPVHMIVVGAIGAVGLVLSTSNGQAPSGGKVKDCNGPGTYGVKSACFASENSACGKNGKCKLLSLPVNCTAGDNCPASNPPHGLPGCLWVKPKGVVPVGFCLINEAYPGYCSNCTWYACGEADVYITEDNCDDSELTQCTIVVWAAGACVPP